MAYSSVRVQFEIGHEASVRNKRTPEGFTHDWEVFVRGADNTEIQCFVEKVVFYLHETFQKPKRVVKEPPYSVKECGYAGFVLPIDVYLKNKEEPRKINFQYDLQLQSSGPPISRVLREPRVFQNPSEDFRRKLIRGGGVGVDTPPEDSKPSPKKPTQSPRKLEEPKSIPPKKHKPELPLGNSFADLFGTPIRRVTPEPKKTSELSTKKVDVDKKKVSKPNSVKEEKEPARDKDKERLKEKEKNKEKTKRPLTPPVINKVKDEVKEKDDRERKKEDSIKVDKDRKEKHKEKDSEKVHRKDKKLKEVENLKKPPVVAPAEKPSITEAEITKENPEKEKHKHRHKKKEKDKGREKEKHKHKDKGEKDRVSDKKKKFEEANGRIEKSKKPSRSPSPVREKQGKGGLDALFDNLSDSASPSDDDEEESLQSARSVEQPPRAIPEIKFTPALDNVVKPGKDPGGDRKSKGGKDDHSNSSKTKKEKSPKKRNSKTHSEHESKRHKFDFAERDKSSSPDREKEIEAAKRQKAEQEKKEKEEFERRMKEREEEVLRKEREAEAAELKNKAAKKEKDIKKRTKEKPTEEEPPKTEDLTPRVELTKEYVAQLRDLQHRIMTLEDNAELQKVVKVIAESGQYEVTKKTFDFDLCTLDYGTVRRLQEFFASPT